MRQGNARTPKDEAAFVTKILVPRRRAVTVRRGRLLDALQRGADGLLTVVRAPAGFGKTTLLVDLAHEAGEGVCWLSLDEWDRDVTTFLQYLRVSIVHGLGLQASKSEPPLSSREPRAVLGELASHIADHDRD